MERPDNLNKNGKQIGHSVKNWCSETIYDSAGLYDIVGNKLQLVSEIFNEKHETDVITNVEKLYPSTIVFQNPLEFPRQQRGQASRPEISSFKAKQRLLNPNKKEATSTSLPQPGALALVQQRFGDVPHSKIFVGGITIYLPPDFNPYPSQRLIIVKIIQALKAKQNALIESLTGSGKSIALLASSISWVQEYKIRITESIQRCPIHGDSEPVVKHSKPDNTPQNTIASTNIGYKFRFNASDKPKQPDTALVPQSELIKDKINVTASVCECLPSLRIYFATRTHSQINQLIQEYNRLPFGHEKGQKRLRHTIFASRNQSCINDNVKKMENVTLGCKELLEQDTFTFKSNLAKFDKPSKLRNVLNRSTKEVWDIEDLVQALKIPEICPYFASTRLLCKDAEIIFLPFNYILDPIVRNSSNITLKNSIVILDEAHNVEDISRQAVSFQFKEYEFAAAIHGFRNQILEIDKKFSNITSSTKDTDESITLTKIETFKQSINRLHAIVKRIFGFFGELAKLLAECEVNKESKTWYWEDLLKILKNKQDPEKNLYFEKDDERFKQLKKDFQRKRSR